MNLIILVLLPLCIISTLFCATILLIIYLTEGTHNDPRRDAFR
jgi:hypothetical protein